jgi:hypothetical protein
MTDPQIAGSEMIGVRSWDALRAEVQHRADVQRYPLTGMDPEDVRAALAATGNKDRDAWAAGWSSATATARLPTGRCRPTRPRRRRIT